MMVSIFTVSQVTVKMIQVSPAKMATLLLYIH